MEKIISYTKKDFRIRWYSGTGAGGQHRNKHQNCCEITHYESGMTERGTKNKSRIANQKDAFNKLANRVVKWRLMEMQEKKGINNVVIRNYNEPRDEVFDKASGLKQSYKKVVKDGDIGDMVESRNLYINADNIVE